MATLIHAGTVITPQNGGVSVYRNHSLVLDGGRVTESSPAATFAGRLDSFTDVIRAERHLVTPGLVNTHHHLYQSLTRCLPAVQNVRLFPWLLGLYERWRAVDFRSIKLAAQVSIAELLLSGCTTTADHFYLLPPASDVRAEAVLEAADELGIRLHLGRGCMTLGQSAGGLPPDELVEQDADVIADWERVIAAYHDPQPHALRRIDIAPCSPFNVTRDLLEQSVQLAKAHGVLLHTHLAETLDEQQFCKERFGCRPAEYLEQLGWLAHDAYLAHCVHVNDVEMQRFAAAGTGVSHNPVSNARLASGVMPLEHMLEAGVRVGLGVDGASSNDGGSLLAAAKAALLSTRIVRGESYKDLPDELPLWSAHDAFRLATIGGAQCLHRAELGHLEVGAAADVALFRMDDVALAGAAVQDPVAALMLCDAPRPDRVLVAGRAVVRDGRLVAADEFALGRALNEVVAERFC
jgi:8-oxoguanine deaminase